MDIINGIKAVLELLELKLLEARSQIAASQPAQNTEAVTLARIESMTRASIFQWLLEMLPGIHRGQIVPPEKLVVHLEEPRNLFGKRLDEVTAALAKGDLSLAQFPRLGQHALVELATTSAVLTWILVLIDPLVAAAAEAVPGAARYIVGNWSHPFSGLSDRECRIVVECESSKIVAMQLRHSVEGWLPARSADVADVQDSIQNANSEALDNPEEFGLQWANELPEWATSNALVEVVRS